MLIKKKSIGFFINITITIVFIFLFIEYRIELLNKILDVDFFWASTGLFFYFLNYFFRVNRMKEVSGVRTVSIPFIYGVFFHGFATYMMPLQSGDLLLPFILKNTAKKDISDGVSILLLLRVLDFFSIGLLIALSIIFFHADISNNINFLWGGTGIVMLITPLIIKFFSSLCKKMVKASDAIISFIVYSIDNNKGVFYSILIWCCVIVYIFCSIKATGLDIGLPQVVFITSIQLPFQVIPVQGIANTGAHEGSWVLALTSIGYSSKEALMISITTHALIISYVLLIGLSGLILYLFNNYFLWRQNQK